MKRILTGVKPTGDFTLGNYIGAMSQIVKMQEEYETFLFVADLHALTVPQDPSELHDRIRKFVAMYIASGVDPNKCVIYIQSENPYIPAMSYLLECVTTYGEASRMIQFKEKSKQNKNFSVGLLTYPVLMAVDILYCDAEYVPVGIDQKQHVELARDIAIRFNNKYGKVFTIPEHIVPNSGAKIKDLKDPSKKMSKSDDSPLGVISMFDNLDDIRKKIKGATTDSDNLVKYDPDNKPGISNLINIVVSLTNRTIEDIEKEFKDLGYGVFKNYVADVVVNKVREVQDKYNKIINSSELDDILNKGRDLSIKMALEKYEKKKKKMGVIR